MSQNMNANDKRALLVTVAFALTAAGIYFMAIEPAEAKQKKLNDEIAALEARQRTVDTSIRQTDQDQNKIKEYQTRMKAYDEAMIEPLLSSYAMRAKQILDPFALGAGLVDVAYEAQNTIALPVPKPLPEQLHARCPIRLTARGSYQAAVSFLLRLEKELPLVALQAMAITAQQDPAEQQIEMVFEWPVKGAVTTQKKGADKK